MPDEGSGSGTGIAHDYRNSERGHRLLRCGPHSLSHRFVLLVVSIAVGCAAPSTAQNTLADAASALRNGRPAEARDLASEWLGTSDESRATAFWVRAQSHEALGNYEEAARDTEELAALEPRDPRVQIALGSARLKALAIDDAIKAFDTAVALEPAVAPELWQRGIAHYFAGRFEDGARQFEIHQTVNSQDVENSVWHFLCVAASHGTDEARSRMIPIARDGRVPMMEVLALFRGEATTDDVLEAARRSSGDQSRSSANLYAHLYLGLYFEALKDRERSADHIAKAVDLDLRGHYMWQVARVHQALRAAEQ